MACTRVPTTLVADNHTIPPVRTFSGMRSTDTAPSLAVETFTNKLIAMASCEAIRKAFRIGKGISAGASSTANRPIVAKIGVCRTQIG